MSERNQIKDRKCNKCGGTVKGKAFAVKDHARTCDGKQKEKKVITLNAEASNNT